MTTLHIRKVFLQLFIKAEPIHAVYSSETLFVDKLIRRMIFNMNGSLKMLVLNPKQWHKFAGLISHIINQKPTVYCQLLFRGCVSNNNKRP